MPELAEPVVDEAPAAAPATRSDAAARIIDAPTARRAGGAATTATVLRKRWRAWLRAIHRDIGYLAVGFTVIYALSGIAMNHIEDWDPNFHATETTRPIAPIPDAMSDADATRQIIAAAGPAATGTISDVYRAGDELRLTFESGVKITAIGGTLTLQTRRDRWFFRIADWLHATRGKQAWKYIADAYATLLLYLAISGLFMIKGRLGLRWRGATLVALGLALPLGYIVLSGGPGAQSTEKAAVRPGEVDPPTAAARPTGDGVKPLPPDDDEATRPAVAGSAAGAAAGDGIKPLPPDDPPARP